MGTFADEMFGLILEKFNRDLDQRSKSEAARPKAEARDPQFQKILDRILRKCAIAESGCWEWQAAASGTKGYGRVKINKRLHSPHRVVAFCVGIIDDAERPAPNTLVLHSCDNPKCCNPAHLRRGTQSENMKECAAKGRVSFQRKDV